ncbi:MAG TPA: 6-phosphogluconolactonase [Jiangellaceae bacterium]
MTPPIVVIHRDPDVLAGAVAARLITRLVDVQTARGAASLVLTGGRIAENIFSAIADSPARAAIDWSKLDVWWGDERFLPSGDTERNETQARKALLDHVPVNPDRVHPMPAADDDLQPEAAAEQYAAELARASRPEHHGAVPMFDVLLLGVGPDAHIASLFPEEPALYDERTVVAVRGAPKPPPTRISLTLPAIRSAAEVWFVVSGDDKAGAVRMALSGAGEVQVPAAGARGRQRTLWLLDRAAASQLPPGLERIASP